MQELRDRCITIGRRELTHIYEHFVLFRINYEITHNDMFHIFCRAYACTCVHCQFIKNVFNYDQSYDM